MMSVDVLNESRDLYIFDSTMGFNDIDVAVENGAALTAFYSRC